MSEGAPVDWEEVRSRLNTLASRAERGFDPSPEEEARLLKQRARDLARESGDPHEGLETLELVEFVVAGEHYAISLEHVREVGVLKELTPVPCTPDFVLGIINLRGEIHTLIDLRAFFDLPRTALTDLNKVLILASDELRIGILADSIRGVRSLLLTDLQPALPTLTEKRAEYLRGITADRLIVLDALRLLDDPSLVVQDAPDI